MKFNFERKLKPKTSKRHFWHKSYEPLLLLFHDCFRTNQMGCEQMFDNLTLERMDASMKQIQYLFDHVSNCRSWIHERFSRF